MKPLLVTLLLLAAGLLVAWALSRESAAQCEVCVRFEGAVACSRARAASQSDALVAAQRSACGQLTRGSMSRELACLRTPSHSSVCKLI